jgi:predicted O-linked N-acetylglucosamine transferase (SPINDLY family)
VPAQWTRVSSDRGEYLSSRIVSLKQFKASFRRGHHALETGRYADALEAFQQLVGLRPDHAPSQHNLGKALYYLGDIEDAVDHFRESIRIAMDPTSLGCVASIAPSDPRLSHAQVLNYRKAWFTSLATISKPTQVQTATRPSRKKVLRIGYVSSFFQYEHWMKPVWGLINHHTTSGLEIHLFSDAPASSVRHGYSTASVHRFHDISGYDNDRAASLILSNQIDILVDLNGFSELNRLPLYLSKPAPLLVAWFNMFATSGMSCVDVLVGDEWVIRKNEEQWYVENVVKLPVSYLTFEVNYPVPEVKPPPCLGNRLITFGSFASLYKINAEVVKAWAAILRRSPSSRLVLGNAQLEHRCNREYTINRFAKFGISRDRLTLLGPETHYKFLQRYDALDIALDPFPYNGGTTTTEAIWQGVPVLTFRGDRWASRTSASIMSNAGLENFVCKDMEDYVDRAVHFGTSPGIPGQLRQLRLQMRTRIKESPVYDCSRLARCMEDVYRKLWQSLLKTSKG